MTTAPADSGDVSRETSLPAATRERLIAYGDLVAEWADRLDLVAPDDVARFFDRHILDSLRPQALIADQPEGPAADVGSGAGLPGIPLAIVGEDRPWRLIEPRRRRAAFLEEAIRVLDLPAEVVAQPAERLATDPGFSRAHVAVTARALAPPVEAFALMNPLVAAGGVAIVWLGRSQTPPPGAELWGPGTAIMRTAKLDG